MVDEAGVVGAIVIAGVAGEVGRCLGGRPRRGGAAGVAPAVPVCGLPPMSRRKYFGLEVATRRDS